MPPELPPELTAKSSDKTLLIAGCVLAGIFGLAGTWVAARKFAGLPINPLAEVPAPPPIPRPLLEPEPEPEPEPAPRVETIEIAERTLRVFYDQKQLLAWARTAPTSGSASLPNPIEMRGKIRLGNASSDAEATPAQLEEAEKARQRAMASARMVSWGEETFSLGEPTDLSIQSTKLTTSSGVFRVEPLARAAPSLEGSMKMYWSRETDDLIAVVQFDWSLPQTVFQSQADAYRRGGISGSCDGGVVLVDQAARKSPSRHLQEPARAVLGVGESWRRSGLSTNDSHKLDDSVARRRSSRSK